MDIIDLSVILSENTPKYPEDPPTKFSPAGVFDKDGYNDLHLSFSNHTGTHVDAPLHMVKKGQTLDQIPIEHFVGRGVYLKVDNEFDVGMVKEADIQEGDIVLFDTGMSGKYFTSEYYQNYPAMPEEIAEYLAYKRVKMVGVDMCSVDKEPYPAHRILLKNQVLIIENLTNLSVLYGKEFTVYALPVKLQGDGSPARVIAKLNKK